LYQEHESPVIHVQNCFSFKNTNGLSPDFSFSETEIVVFGDLLIDY